MQDTYHLHAGSSGVLKTSGQIGSTYFESGAVVNWLPLNSSYSMPLKLKMGVDPSYLDIYTYIPDQRGSKGMIKLPDFIPTPFASIATTKERIFKHKIRKGKYDGKEEYNQAKLNGQIGLKIWLIKLSLADVSIIFKEDSKDKIEIVGALSLGIKTPDLGSIPVDMAIESNGKILIKLKVEAEELNRVLVIKNRDDDDGPPPSGSSGAPIDLFEPNFNYKSALESELLNYAHFEQIVQARNKIHKPILDNNIISNTNTALSMQNVHRINLVRNMQAYLNNDVFKEDSILQNSILSSFFTSNKVRWW